MARDSASGLLLALAAGVGLYLISTGAYGGDAVDAPEDPTVPPSDPPVDTSTPAPDMTPELAAFLYMIRSAENRQVDDGLRYFRGYGNRPFSGISDHPVITGELAPVPLPPSMCKAAGFASGVCVSTAAGAYQMTVPTWRRVRSAGAWGDALADFSPGSQDAAALRLLAESGVDALVQAGNVPGAIARASRLWASLPGSKAGQSPVDLQSAMGYYSDGLAQG